MKNCIWLLLIFIVACETTNTSQQEMSDSEEDIVSNNENYETPDEVDNEDEILETASSSPLLERPTERRERDESSIISYVREGIEPERIEIPILGIDAHIEHVGLLENGQMDEPSNMEDIAWYEGGYMPGEQGSSVLAGHVNSREGPAVFFDLESLEQGDEIIITGGEGEERVFVVQESLAYDRNDAPLQNIFGYSYQSQLNLITCTGEFNQEAGTHDERLVVYTVLKDDLHS